MNKCLLMIVLTALVVGTVQAEVITRTRAKYRIQGYDWSEWTQVEVEYFTGTEREGYDDSFFASYHVFALIRWENGEEYVVELDGRAPETGLGNDVVTGDHLAEVFWNVGGKDQHGYEWEILVNGDVD